MIDIRIFIQATTIAAALCLILASCTQNAPLTISGNESSSESHEDNLPTKNISSPESIDTLVSVQTEVRKNLFLILFELNKVTDELFLEENKQENGKALKQDIASQIRKKMELLEKALDDAREEAKGHQELIKDINRIENIITHNNNEIARLNQQIEMVKESIDKINTETAEAQENRANTEVTLQKINKENIRLEMNLLEKEIRNHNLVINELNWAFSKLEDCNELTKIAREDLSKKIWEHKTNMNIKKNKLTRMRQMYGN